jgi:2-polyprenyl-3-methyl-5-hydroxy-6-metoxy-1,4-benzoquinol methylase
MHDAIEPAMRGKGIDLDAYPAATHEALGRMARARSASVVAGFLSDGVRATLEAGAEVLEVGCGQGHASMELAAMFPRVRITAVDRHAASIARARAASQEAGVADRITFLDEDVRLLGSKAFDVAFSIEALHELANPDAIVRMIRGVLRDEGRFLVVEQRSENSIAENLNASGRLLAATNLLFCLPTSRAAGGGALGNLAGERRLRDLLERAGFTSVTSLSSDMYCILEAAR